MRNLSERPFYGLLKEYEHWVVLFRDKQVTPGSVIIMDKTVQARSLGDISSDAWGEFGVITKEVEGWLTKAFGAEKFNYLALMMKDPEVHFHVIPRYSKPVKIGDNEYTDADWPLKTELNSLAISDNDTDEIKKRLQDVIA